MRRKRKSRKKIVMDTKKYKIDACIIIYFRL